MASSRPQPLPCPTWVWSKKSNVHVAKDRFWLGEDYTPCKSFVRRHDGSNANLRVVGIKSVRIHTQISPHRSGPRSHATITLKRVLHVPDSVCNIVGHDPEDDYRIAMSRDDSIAAITSKADGQPVGHFKSGKILRLSGPPVGPKLGTSHLKPSMKFMACAKWPASERERFRPSTLADESANESTDESTDDSADESDEYPAVSMLLCTAPEITWIKEHYGNELEFLKAHGLSFYVDEECEEGPRILRELMSKKDDANSTTDESIDYMDMAIERGLRNVNRLFSSDELDWINQNHESPLNFMYHHALDCGSPSNCDTAKELARHHIRAPNQDTETVAAVESLMNMTKVQIEIFNDIQEKLSSILRSDGNPQVVTTKMESILNDMTENSWTLNEAIRKSVRTMMKAVKKQAQEEN